MSSSSSEAAAAAAETKSEKNKNSIGNTDTGTDATATATATVASATAASTTLTIDDEYDGCSSCVRAACGGEEKNDNNNNNNKKNDLTIARAMHVIESLTSLYGVSSDAANEAMNNINALNGNNKDSSNHNDSIDTMISLCCDYILDNGLGMDDGGAITPINNCPHVVQKIISENDDDDTNNTNKMCCCVLITPTDIPNTIFELSCQYYRDNNNSNNNNINNNKEEEKQTEKPATIVGKFKDDIEYADDNKMGSIATCPKGENWFCLYCGGLYCSRYVNGHGLQHYEDTNTNTNDNTTKSNTNTTNTDSSHCCVMVGLADLSIWCHKCESYLETHNNTYLNSIINKLQQIKFD